MSHLPEFYNAPKATIIPATSSASQVREAVPNVFWEGEQIKAKSTKRDSGIPRESRNSWLSATWTLPSQGEVSSDSASDTETAVDMSKDTTATGSSPARAYVDEITLDALKYDNEAPEIFDFALVLAKEINEAVGSPRNSKVVEEISNANAHAASHEPKHAAVEEMPVGSMLPPIEEGVQVQQQGEKKDNIGGDVTKQFLVEEALESSTSATPDQNNSVTAGEDLSYQTCSEHSEITSAHILAGLSVLEDYSVTESASNSTLDLTRVALVTSHHSTPSNLPVTEALRIVKHNSVQKSTAITASKIAQPSVSRRRPAKQPVAEIPLLRDSVTGRARPLSTLIRNLENGEVYRKTPRSNISTAATSSCSPAVKVKPRITSPSAKVSSTQLTKPVVKANPDIRAHRPALIVDPKRPLSSILEQLRNGADTTRRKDSNKATVIRRSPPPISRHTETHSAVSKESLKVLADRALGSSSVSASVAVKVPLPATSSSHKQLCATEATPKPASTPVGPAQNAKTDASKGMTGILSRLKSSTNLRSQSKSSLATATKNIQPAVAKAQPISKSSASRPGLGYAKGKTNEISKPTVLNISNPTAGSQRNSASATTPSNVAPSGGKWF